MDPAHSTLSRAKALLRKAPKEVDQQRIGRAIEFAHDLYGSRAYELFDDRTLFDHALQSTEFLVSFCPEEDALVASILQHALRIPDGSLEDIQKQFGRTVRDIVSRVHLLSHLFTADWRKSVDDSKLMLVSVSDDVRVLLIALSIAGSLMQRLGSVRQELRMRLARQSLQLFAPVAARLGIYALKYQLERAAFPECYPTDSEHIRRQLRHLQTEHGSFLNRTSLEIGAHLREHGIDAEVSAREKQSYSIFQKMHQKSVTALEKITDLFAIRVVVDSVHDCYQTLGLIHQLGTPLSHRFKDYISFPKPNGYQSLHTCMLSLPHVPKDLMVEIQIRTKEMHREAEFGVAAHWLYKQLGKGKVLRGAEQYQLSDVLLKQHAVGVASEERNSTTTLVDHIYVLTPRGDILELPEGATPLDFAFMVHTDIGLRYKSARVNGSIAPIAQELENGDVVEILTHKEPRPALQWMEELRTPGARSKLKAYFFAHNRPQFLQKGRDIVNGELKDRRLPLLDNNLTVLSIFDGKPLSLKEREDFLVRIGMGSMRGSSILRHLTLSQRTSAERSDAVSAKGMRKATSARARIMAPPKQRDLVAVDGEKLSMPYRFAKCCKPDEMKPRPEKIVGVVGKSAVVVHKDGCKMAKGANPERRLRMHWVK